jgi:hypothetical protein
MEAGEAELLWIWTKWRLERLELLWIWNKWRQERLEMLLIWADLVEAGTTLNLD